MARLLRLAAVAVAIAAIAAAVLPMLWWRTMKAEQGVLLHDTYLYIDAAGTVGLLVGAAAVALVLMAQARIIERLDEIRAASGRREDAET